MRILILSFFYEPDLSACSFRNTALVKTLRSKLSKNDRIDVITTFPNRYHTYKTSTQLEENDGNVFIRRIPLSEHKNGFADQILSFQIYFRKVYKLVSNEKYDIIYASSSKLFTAFLGALLSKIKNVPLYLDIRDIFVDTINDVIKNKAVKASFLPFLRMVESFTFRSADHINLVSEGFRDYFEKIYDGPITFYSNGIDDDFIQWNDPIHKRKDDRKVITYAGNIGEGQGLEKIIPEAASKLGEKYLFRVIGDGGTRQKLVKKVAAMNLKNVELIPPVSRKELIKYYNESDYLFLHLNNYKAFEKVLPSKIFEYGALKKRIVAGVAGYSRSFIENNLPGSIIFEPGNTDELLRKLLNDADYQSNGEEFIKKYSRSAIIDRMADSVLNTIKYRVTSDEILLPESLEQRATKV